MRKYYFILALLLNILFQGCIKKDTYHYIDKSALYYFKVGDTLTYQSIQSVDTFWVTTIFYSFHVEGNTDYYQMCDILIQRLSDNIYSDLNDSIVYIRQKGYRINIDWVFFHNCAYNCEDSIMTYPIGSHQINNVYVLINSDSPDQVVYYNYNYGLVAYKLNDELFELEERYLVEAEER
jgi:hypothetical protein